MNNKNMDELLSGLKKEYKRMPEQVDKRTIMQRVFRKKRKPRFGKAMPLVAVIAGLFLFALVSLPYLNDYDQADNNPSYLEMYYLNALEDFRESLGLDDVEEFREVTMAESVVEHYGSSPSSEDYEDAKEKIDHYLTTTKEMVEEAKSKGEFFADDEQFNRKMTQMLYSFQTYFSDLQVEYGIQRKDQDALLDAQGNPENYQGPQEIKNFLIVLDEQGFRVTRNKGTDRLSIGLDFSWQLEQSEGLTGSEGYMHYLELMEDMAGNFYNIERNEIATILLEVEYIYDTYPDERELIFENTSLLIEVNNYLREYLALSLVGEIDHEVMLEEYYSFLEKHEDSRFWEIVKARVDTIEMESIDYLNFRLDSQLHLLFNEQFDGITFNDIIDLNYDDRYRAQDIQQSYVEYSETKDEKLLANLDGAELTLLYKYAFVRREAELYSTLYAAESEWNSYGEEELHEALMEEGWMDVFDLARYLVIQEDSGGGQVTATFIIGYEASAQLEWMKEDGVWKLLDQTVEEAPHLDNG
ncbi:hypothetical protein ACDX78_20510 [Virgibacillus oceani]